MPSLMLQFWRMKAGARFPKLGTDDPAVFSAYLRTLRWNTATAADRDLFQAPFRAGIHLDPYQLLPLQKALRLPRVNLLIADDVGAGKTVEAGLVLRELLLRRRLDEAHHAAPASGSRYAVDSQFTRAVRGLAERYQHRLFLSATPHNGHSNSFSALLEILDPQRFTRGVPVRPRDLAAKQRQRLPEAVRVEVRQARRREGFLEDGPDRTGAAPVLAVQIHRREPEIVAHRDLGRGETADRPAPKAFPSADSAPNRPPPRGCRRPPGRTS